MTYTHRSPKSLLLLSTFLFTVFISCNSVDSDVQQNGNNGSQVGSSEWLIPSNEVIDGGPGQDGIPSIDQPNFISVSEANFLDNRLVVGIKIGSEIKLYPHQILDWHEIVNDTFNDKSVALTYCPLTGTGIAFNRVIDGSGTEFGVSGLLFRNNLIMYDRNTGSRWSQMQMRSVNGELIGREGAFIQTIQTDWKTWKQLYPDARVLSRSTGFSRNYDSFTYGEGYLTNDNTFVFQPKRQDNRLPNKAQVHAVFPFNFDGESTIPRIYSIDNFDADIEVIEEPFDGQGIVTVGSSEHNFAVSFYSRTSDGTQLSFQPVQNELPVIMKDEEGNKYNIFGEAVSGPREGSKLSPTKSYNGYWFAFADFYPGSCIYPETSCLSPSSSIKF
jgi:hypothetical protein